MRGATAFVCPNRASVDSLRNWTKIPSYLAEWACKLWDLDTLWSWCCDIHVHLHEVAGHLSWSMPSVPSWDLGSRVSAQGQIIPLPFLPVASGMYQKPFPNSPSPRLLKSREENGSQQEGQEYQQCPELKSPVLWQELCCPRCAWKNRMWAFIKVPRPL